MKNVFYHYECYCAIFMITYYLIVGYDLSNLVSLA